MSSFRRPKSEASLRLYNLPRRELQALCKQYGIPANKTNVAMADALSACVPVDTSKTKASSGSNSLGVAKTTPMKLKMERKTAVPETSLAAFILSGKRKASPVKLPERPTVAHRQEASFPKPNTTPLKRGVKRSERSYPTLPEEKSRVTVFPAITRAAAIQDRLGKAAGAAVQDRLGKAPAAAVSSPKSRALTPRKRATEAAAIVTTRGRDLLQPVPFSDLLTTPQKSEPQVHESTQLDASEKGSKKKSRLGLRTGPQEEEATPPLSHAAAASKVSRGKRVAFADEVEVMESGNRKPKPQPEPHTETMETIEVSSAEIEFKDSALHKELLGFPRNITIEEEQDVAPALREESEHREDASQSTQEAGFEFRDVALHKELFGLQQKSETELAHPLAHDLQQAETSGSAEIEPASLECEIGSSPEVLNHLNTTPAQDLPVLSSVREDSHSKVEALEEFTERHLPQGRDLGSLLDDVPCTNSAEKSCEKSMGVPDHSHAISLNRMQSDTTCTLEQEPVVSPSADVHLGIDMGDIQGPQLESTLDVGTLVDDLGDHTGLKEKCSEETHVSISESGAVQRSPQEQSKASPSATSTKGVVVTAGPEISGPRIAVTPLTKIQNNIDSTLAKATSILEKLAAWRADAERKVAEGYWEPKFSSVMPSQLKSPQGLIEVEGTSAAAEVEKPKTVLIVDRDLPSAKKARHAPKAISGSEKGLTICEDADTMSKGEGEMPSAKKIRTSDEPRDFSEVSDKENQSEKCMEDRGSRKLGGLGKDKKKGKKFEVLKDRPKNLADHGNNENALGSKEGTGQVRLEDMSLRKLRAQVKEKVRQLETSKALRNRNMAH